MGRRTAECEARPAGGLPSSGGGTPGMTATIFLLCVRTMLNKYLITINSRNGLSEVQVELLNAYMKSRFVCVVANTEKCKSGAVHYHAHGESQITRAGVRNHLARWIENVLKIEMTTNLLKVQSSDAGSRQYIVKEVTDEKPVQVCQGWSILDLLKERQLALKTIKVKKIVGDDRAVSPDEAVSLIIRFAQSSETALTDKHSFRRIIKDMGKMGFRFHRIKFQIVYAEVMNCLDNEGPYDDWLEHQLCMLR